MELPCDNCGRKLYLDATDGTYQFCSMCREQIKQTLLGGLKKKRVLAFKMINCRDCNTLIERKLNCGVGVCGECRKKVVNRYYVLRKREARRIQRLLKKRISP